MRPRYDAAVISDIVGVLFGIIFVAVFLVIALARWGTVFPRFGRWLDAQMYRVFPRLGHLFITDEEVDASLPSDTGV